MPKVSTFSRIFSTFFTFCYETKYLLLFYNLVIYFSGKSSFKCQTVETYRTMIMKLINPLFMGWGREEGLPASGCAFEVIRFTRIGLKLPYAYILSIFYKFSKSAIRIK